MTPIQFRKATAEGRFSAGGKNYVLKNTIKNKTDTDIGPCSTN